MNRLSLALLPLLAGALFATVDAQPAPPKPPKPPKAPKAPRAPLPPAPPDPWSPDVSAQVADQLRESLDDSIDEIEADDSIPPAIKARILKAMRKAQKSGDPRDLAELGNLSKWGQDLGAAVQAEVEKELRKAGISGGHGPHGGVNIDLGRLQGDLERLRALQQHRDDDGDDGDDAVEDDDSGTSDWSDDSDDSADGDDGDSGNPGFDPRDWQRMQRDQTRMERERERMERDRARMEHDRDSWGHWDDGDHGSPFDGDLGWLQNIPFAPDALAPGMPSPPPDIQLNLDLDLDDLRLDRGKLAQLDRIASDEQAATAQAELEVKKLGGQLQAVVRSSNPNEEEIGRLVDLITVQEAVIRKARLSAMIKTRKLFGK